MLVGVRVGVLEGVGVSVGVSVAVGVRLAVGVLVGVFVGVLVGVEVESTLGLRSRRKYDQSICSAVLPVFQARPIKPTYVGVPTYVRVPVSYTHLTLPTSDLV